MATPLVFSFVRRPSILVKPSVSRLVSRFASNKSSSLPDPKTRAAALIDALPGNSVVSKTGFITLGTGAAAWTVSNELFVVNEEAVILGAFSVLLGLIYSSAREPWNQYADGVINKIKSVLDSAKEEHTQAVKSRIDDVSGMQDVVSLTRSLFDLSKATARLEHDSFIRNQKVQLTQEIQSALDSWVRFEAQARESEQREVVKTVINKVMQDLEDPKLQKDILQQSVAEIESLVKAKAV